MANTNTANIKAKNSLYKNIKVQVNACGINDVLRVINLSLGLLLSLVLLSLVLFLPEVRLATVGCSSL